MKQKKYSSFTLVEMIIIVVIVSIIAMLALPGFVASKRKAQLQELLAIANLTDQAVRVYRLREYNAANCIGSSNCNQIYNLDLAAIPAVNVTVNGANWCVEAIRDNRSVYMNRSMESPVEGNCTGHCPAM